MHKKCGLYILNKRGEKNAVGLGKNAVWPGKNTIFRAHFTKKFTIVKKKLAGNDKRRKDEKAILPENAEKMQQFEVAGMTWVMRLLPIH